MAAQSNIPDETSPEVSLARAAILRFVMKLAGRSAGIDGKIDCPVCHKREGLAFVIQPYGGPISGVCSTSGCVAFKD